MNNNARATTDWSSDGFRANYNPHEALQQLEEALSSGPSSPDRDPLPQQNQALTTEELETLTTFISTIPAIAPHREAHKDDQLAGLSLARALFKRFRRDLDATQLNALASEVAKLPGAVSDDKHTHSFVREVGVAARKGARTIRKGFQQDPGIISTMLVVGTATFGAAPVGLAAGTLSAAIHHTLKDDKTTNKALKFLQEVLQSIGNGQVADAPFNEAVQVLLAAPKEQSRKVEGLYHTLRAKATEEQRATLQSNLQEGGKRHLLSLTTS